MEDEFDMALRYRNYAEELRVMAADKAPAEVRKSLLDVAAIYDHTASSLEAIDRSKRSLGLKPKLA